jgi:hypothetical protein
MSWPCCVLCFHSTYYARYLSGSMGGLRFTTHASRAICRSRSSCLTGGPTSKATTRCLRCVLLVLRATHLDETMSLQWDGKTPLHLAARMGHLDMVDLLISRGADIESRTKVRLPAAPLR